MPYIFFFFAFVSAYNFLELSNLCEDHPTRSRIHTLFYKLLRQNRDHPLIFIDPTLRACLGRS